MESLFLVILFLDFVQNCPPPTQYLFIWTIMAFENAWKFYEIFMNELLMVMYKRTREACAWLSKRTLKWSMKPDADLTTANVVLITSMETLKKNYQASFSKFKIHNLDNNRLSALMVFTYVHC